VESVWDEISKADKKKFIITASSGKPEHDPEDYKK